MSLVLLVWIAGASYAASSLYRGTMGPVRGTILLSLSILMALGQGAAVVVAFRRGRHTRAPHDGPAS